MTYHDAHVHFFPTPLKNAIDQWFAAAGWRLHYRGIQSESLLENLRADGADHLAVLVYAHKSKIAASLNSWLYQFGLQHDGLHLFGTVHPGDSDMAREVARCLDEWNFTGFKLHANVQQVSVDDPRLTPLMEGVLARRRGLVIHAGREPHTNSYVGWQAFSRLMAHYPQLKVQVAHLGYDEIGEFIAMSRDYPHLYFDTAAVPSPRFPLDDARFLDIVKSVPNRIIYGSDMPVMEESVTQYRHRISKILGDSPALQHKVFVANAERFWGVEEHSSECGTD